ncbi:MAG: hypothetical protein Q4B40_05895 [Clostridia bacterium]|nr:hypothetical protein [Clostridia bacterium]
MDRYLFEKFVFPFDDELYENACMLLAQQAENIIRKPNSEKVTFNYYPQVPSRLQFVVEGIWTDNSIGISGVKVHHTSEDVWKLKIVTSIKDCDRSYLATRPDGGGLVAVRLVNEHVLDKIEENNIVEAQMVAFAIDINIYQDENAYHEAQGEKILMADGLVIATNFLVNNSANLTEEERNAKEHCLDNLVDICGTITNCFKYPLKMFDMDFNSYYIANIMTDFGQLKVVIPRSLFPKDINGFFAGNVIVGKVVLSGDVCIYDYDKYLSPLKNNNSDT